MIEPGNIIKNLSPTEAVIIDKIRKLGSKYSLSYTGVNSNKRASKILDEQQMEALEVLASDGEFNFKGDPEKFVLFAEAERIKSLIRLKLSINIFFHSPRFVFFLLMIRVRERPL